LALAAAAFFGAAAVVFLGGIVARNWMSVRKRFWGF
jgi:hypothetical protein